MPVNLLPPNPAELLSVKGVRLGVAQAGIRKAGRKDLLVIALDEGVRVAGAFTQNRFCAAPVVIARQHLSMVDPMSGVRALVVNTGNANAGTGRQGMNDARAVCNSLAQLLGCEATQVLPFSTGVILEPLPVDRVTAGLPACLADLTADNWASAAEAIMTTDTVPKAVSRTVKVNGVQVRVTGIAKGSGMIHPNMATMLGFIATDAKVAQPLLRSIVQHAVKRSFNAITVDGDTSTNDSFIVMATGRASMDELQSAESGEYRELCEGISDAATQLAQAIVRDGEGATKFITVRVEGGRSEDECRRIAYAIAHSPLVKTAFFASDPNLGRILAAIGYSGVADLDVEKLDLFLDDVRVATRGGRDPEYREQDGNRVMQKSEITVRVALSRGDADATVWTCDLSHDYVKINAEYRT